ncbi:hypothetical protein [Streptomyces sp. Ru87]|uniref:hypothetical protein n=1 Tax=Streptomyces sp. Ru87 TaxID=2044307 RepID=UPI000BF80307|nr:hypothetical protein [Streptomyces sp. Ru87]PGH49795.1 hypothetical protein CRI70_15570 [Streptomyces sp. Ru87]
MGSLRNPVGPLPSSIYWRRRAVALCLLALLAALAVWAVTSGGGSGNGDGKGGANGDGPAESITPGPSSSGPAISERPGGRDESGGGDDGGGGNPGGSGGVDGGTDAGGGGEGGSSGGSGGSGGGGGGSGGGGGGEWNGIPVGTSLPRCGPGSVELKLHSVENTYAPGEKPEIELTAENSSGQDCKVDFGAPSAVLTITSAEGDDPVWASDDCLRDSAGILLRVPAGGTARYTLEWDREPSAPECATPSDRSVKAGTYLVEAEADGLKTAKTSFVLAKD